VLPLSGGDPARAIVVASMMAMVVGLVCILAGILRLGFFIELPSKPIRHGYMNGIALTVLISQLPKLAGVSIDADGPGQALWQFAQAMRDGRCYAPTLAIGAGALVLILALERFERMPGILVADVLATSAVTLLDLGAAGVAVMGEVPQALPAFVVPWLSGVDLLQIVLGGVAVALLSFADTSVLSRSYAARLRAPVGPNQAMVGPGTANLAAGFFQGFAASNSSSRTPVAEAAGAKTQLTGVVGALGVAVLLMLAPGRMNDLPTAALAAVVIASALRLFEVADLHRIRRMQAWEFWLSMGCFGGVVALGPIPGIGLAVVLAVMEFLWDGRRLHFAVLGRVDGLRGCHDVARYPHARRVPGLLLLRWDAPLFFANAEWFQQSVLRAAGVELHCAEMKNPVKDKIGRFELSSEFPAECFHPTVGAAVEDHLADHGVAWTRSTSRPWSASPWPPAWGAGTAAGVLHDIGMACAQKRCRGRIGPGGRLTLLTSPAVPARAGGARALGFA
jgi:MFS superfamily sulfate permease-like transporter